MNLGWVICLFGVVRAYDVLLWGVFRCNVCWPIVGWCSVSVLVMFSAVEVFVDCGGVYVFHICWNVHIVYGVGVCVDVCVVDYWLFLESRCCLL